MESQDIVTPVIQVKLNPYAMSTRLFNLHKTAKTGTAYQKSGIVFSL